jgi:tRNA(adenine34) deaminase
MIEGSSLCVKSSDCFLPLGGNGAIIYSAMGHEEFMQAALEEAKSAALAGDVPVGAVAVWRGQIIGRGRNRKEEWRDPTAHAEILALREAARSMDSWRLAEVTLYSTLEPCPMCAGAIIQARIALLVYALADPLTGAAGSVLDLLRLPYLNHRVEVLSGVLADEVVELMDGFFRRLRSEAPWRKT